MSFHVRAAAQTGIATRRSRWIEPGVVVVHEFLEPSVGCQPLIAICRVPQSLFTGFSEGDAAPVAFVLRRGGRVLHVFACHFDREYAGVEWETLEIVRQ